MLSYKYYRDINSTRSKTNISMPLINVNNLIKSGITTSINKSLNDFKYPKHECHNRYNIWDNIADYIDTILSESALALIQIDKLYLLKLLADFRDHAQINKGIEYYCLRYIIRLSAFRYNKSLSNLYMRISNHITNLYMDKITRKAVNIFARNVHKMGFVKKLYKSPIMFRTIWCDIYNCYSIGDQAFTELLNKTEILKALKYPESLEQDSNSIDDTLEILSTPDELPSSDSELDTASITGSQDIADIDQSTESQLNSMDTLNIPDDNNYIELGERESLNENYEAEIDELAVDPDEW